MADFGLTEIAAIAGIASSIGGTIMGAAGQQQQADANAASANYQAQVAKNNATIAEQNRVYSIKAGEANAQSRDFQTRAVLGQAFAGQGASGLDVTSGSQSDVQRGIHDIGRLDTANTFQQALMQGYGYGTQASNYQAQSDLFRQQAGYARQAGSTAVAGTLLSGVGNLSSKWLQYSNAGIVGGGPTGGDYGGGGELGFPSSYG